MTTVEVLDVIDLANYLEISEYDLFRLAYIWWFSGEPDPVRLERDFKKYLLENRIPPYVQHFVRINPLVEDNGQISVKWLSVMSHLQKDSGGHDACAA